MKRLFYILFRGVHMNLRFPYMVHGLLMLITPKCLYRYKRKLMLKHYETLDDKEKEYIDHRVNYYCKIPDNIVLADINEQLPNGKAPYQIKELGDHTFRKKTGNTVYFFDTYEYTRYFPQHIKWLQIAGDVFYKLPAPAITKSRLIPAKEEYANEVIINQDKIRHFCFIHDPITWEEKKTCVLFRGACHGKPRRELFLQKFIHHPLFDIKDTAKDSSNPPEWQQKKELSLYDHLEYRYIIALEGNDVASNLKWVMSSNSIAVMPRPTCETWFMEGELIPNYHYIEIREDYTDLIERINYYEAHPEEAKEIVQHAHEWCSQFQDKDREDIISVLVLQKYFKASGQL
jgi:hypothetical protein